MRTAELRYELPPDAIAQRPAEEREAARLLVLRRQGVFEHRRVGELPELLPRDGLVVVNDTRVVRARLLGRKRSSGGRAEVFLVRRRKETGDGREFWLAMGRASKGLRAGTIVEVGEPKAGLTITILGLDEEEGLLEVSLEPANGATVAELVAQLGRVPLPPYIRREADHGDIERYQTVFARVDGAVAAPTAGLHLTQALLQRLRDRGCMVATVTLHVGLGTFAPVTVEDLNDHVMHEEWFDVPEATARAVAAARERGAPVIAVGTTVVRALESAVDRRGFVRATAGTTRLLIQPGYDFKAIDMLLTNFHLPESTLLALVSAFGGTARVLAGYREAVAQGYRFFSYGDAMLLSCTGKGQA